MLTVFDASAYPSGFMVGIRWILVYLMSFRTSGLFSLHSSQRESASFRRSSRPNTSFPCIFAMYLNSGWTVRTREKCKCRHEQQHHSTVSRGLTYVIGDVQVTPRIQWRTKAHPKPKVPITCTISSHSDIANELPLERWPTLRSSDAWTRSWTFLCSIEPPLLNLPVEFASWNPFWRRPKPWK